MAKKSPMEASAFWDTLEKSANNGWASLELHNLLAYWLRKDLALADKSPLDIIRGYREWYESPTNANDDSIPTYARRQQPERELLELVMTFRTCPEFKTALKS